MKNNVTKSDLDKKRLLFSAEKWPRNFNRSEKADRNRIEFHRDL